MSAARAEDLKQELRRAERRKQRRTLGLVAPPALFLFVVFALPIALMLFRAIQNPEIVENFPQTAEQIQHWDGQGVPDETVIATFVAELRAAADERRLANPGRRLNYEINGYRSLLRRTAYSLPDEPKEGSWTATLRAFDSRWGETTYWRAIKDNATPYTLDYFLSALDLKRAADGGIQWVAPDEAIFLDIYARTFWMAFVITASALLLGYPVAYLMTNGSRTTQAVLLFFVLLPFWTSLMVRTAAWMVLLQTNGPINDFLLWLGVIGEPLELLYNRIGVYIGMIHVLLPFMIMPIYAVMRGIPASHMRAATSLGAPPWRAFLRVYLPQTLPGVAAGCLLVCILAIGFYITPALLGESDDQLISYFIAFYTNETLNWGLASALSVILLLMVFVLYGVFTRVAGFGRIQVS